ncbi:aminotransferase class IV [Botryobacter ruber]|uniref:aminotransferase class IV n=1 Tax=Botryobacter ruber TaxID=2171629 RepID=UPI000E0B3628|nr:aminotransferase class IV [Botryobacter ruber]
MHLLYNGQLLQEKDLRLPLTNRAFQYNDGFFETVIVKDGQLRCWQDHQDRLQAAARALQLALPQALQQPLLLQEQLQQLIRQNNATAYGRLKLKVWRSGAGLYTPETTTADWLATAAPATTPTAAPLRVGRCRGVRTSFSPFSFFKGPNALLYVMAGLEKKAKGTDDMLLLSTEGHAAELASANLFWIKEGSLYTPALGTGCVNGILRRNILRWCKAAGVTVQEEFATPDQLVAADAAFAANVTGIRSIAQVEEMVFNPEHPLVTWLQQQVDSL